MKTGRFGKKAISLVLSFCLTFSIVGMASANTVTDTDNHWARHTIDKWISQGYVEGYGDGTFRPDTYITRSEVAALINRAFNFDIRANINFSDVNTSQWFYNDIAVASGAEYIKGNADGTFKPDNGISRQELMVIFASILDLKASDSYKDNVDTKNSPNWSKDQIGAAIDTDIIKGYTDETFKLTNAATRAEVIVMLERATLMNPNTKVVKYNKEGTYGPIEDNLVIKGDVVVNVPNVTLQNMTITGDLLLAAGIGEGDAFMNNVRVMGNTIIKGGENNIHFSNSELTTIIVNKNTDTARIAIAGASTVEEIIVQSSATIEELGNATGTGVGTVTLSNLLPRGSKVTLIGSFDNVDNLAQSIHLSIPKGSVNNLSVGIDAIDSSIDVGEDAEIKSLVLHATTNLLGSGKIVKATLNDGAGGSTFEYSPDTVDGPQGHSDGK